MSTDNDENLCHNIGIGDNLLKSGSSTSLGSRAPQSTKLPNPEARAEHTARPIADMFAPERCDMTPQAADSRILNQSPESDIAGEAFELQPFPTDILSEEILHLILYHVLSEPDFGKNGRWSSREEAAREKAQWSTAHKQRAALHRKFCLIHRSWTPFVLRSLYRSPRLTSKFAILRLHECLAHPEALWGVEVDEKSGKVVGGAVGDRRYFVRHLGFHTGTGREGSMDWIRYSGEWISLWATRLVALSPRLYGWEIEGWCSRDCGEGGYQDRNQEAIAVAERLLPLTRISLSRVPSTADLISVVLNAYPTLRILEMLEMSRNVFGEAGSRASMYRALQACPLEILAVKAAGGNRREGVLDDLLKTIPGIRHLHLAADLISPAFFFQELPKNLTQVLFGCTTRRPVIFDGREAVEELWQIGCAFAKPNSAYASDAQMYNSNRPSPSESECHIHHSNQLAALHGRFMYASEYPPLQYEHDYLSKIQDELLRSDLDYVPNGHLLDWENAFAYDIPHSDGEMPPVGLESWLIEETGEDGALRNIALQGSEVEHISQSLCWKD